MEIKTHYDPLALGLNVARKSGNEYIVFCPYHSDSKPSAEYNPSKDLFYCFGCHESANAQKLAEDLSGELIPVSHSVSTLHKHDEGITLDWMDFLKNPLAIDNKYLANREVSNRLVRQYKIKENSDGVIFPLFNKFLETTAIQIRHYKKKPKYLFYGERPPIWPMQNLYKKPGPLYIVEGVFGVMRLEKYGLNSVALLGTSSVLEAYRVLHMTRHEPYSLLDPDFAGTISAGKLTLLGVPAILQDTSADELDESTIYKVRKAIPTGNVMDVVNASPDPFKALRLLKKFYNKLEKGYK